MVAQYDTNLSIDRGVKCLSGAGWTPVALCSRGCPPSNPLHWGMPILIQLSPVSHKEWYRPSGSVCRTRKFHKIKKENREKAFLLEYHHCNKDCSVACNPMSGQLFPLRLLFHFVLMNKWTSRSTSTSSVTLSPIFSLATSIENFPRVCSKSSRQRALHPRSLFQFQVPPVHGLSSPGPLCRFQTKRPFGYVQ